MMQQYYRRQDRRGMGHTARDNKPYRGVQKRRDRSSHRLPAYPGCNPSRKVASSWDEKVRVVVSFKVTNRQIVDKTLQLQDKVREGCPRGVGLSTEPPNTYHVTVVPMVWVSERSLPG